MLSLEGIVVVDLSRALAGPYCTTMLADFGADVIKVEAAGAGDPARSWPPFDQEGRSLYFESVNRNKRSVTIDFYSAEGREVLAQVLEHADVLVENFKFGTLARMGFDESVLNEINPELLHVSINAYGGQGPLRDLPGLDQVIQGASGITSVTGPCEGPGYRVGLPIVDITSGMNAAFGIVAALFGKQRGIPAARVSTSLFESALALSVFQGQQALTLDEPAKPQGNSHPTIAPYGAYSTSTEAIVVAVSTDKHWNSFNKILGNPEWGHDSRFLTGRDRNANRALLDQLIESVLSKEAGAYWIERFREAGIPSGPIHDYKQALRSEQSTALSMTQQVERVDGSMIELVRGPLSVDGKATTVRKAPPELGEHTCEVLAQVGMNVEEITGLLKKKAITSPGNAVHATNGPIEQSRVRILAASGGTE